MAEYIDRDDAIKVVNWQSSITMTRAAMNYAIKSIPAADVAPVVHGRWVHHDDGVVTCSECGNAESSESYYCRYCGAKMDL